MQTLPIRGSGLRVTAPYGMSKRSVIVKAFKDETTPSVPVATSWQVPEQLKPVVTFLAAEDQKLESVVAPITKSELYTKYAASFVESPVAAQSIGWKKIPETVNGRLAMLGFTAGALAEIFVQKSLLTQFASLPQAVVVTVALITAATIIPVVKATEGDYLASLRDTYSIPEGVFTETNEKVFGRLAMLGIAGLIAIELLIGRALL